MLPILLMTMMAFRGVGGRARPGPAAAGMAGGAAAAPAAEVPSQETQDTLSHKTKTRTKKDYERRIMRLREYLTAHKPNDPAVLSGQLKDMHLENFRTYLSTRVRTRNPNKGDPVLKGDLQHHKDALVWHLKVNEHVIAANIFADFGELTKDLIESHGRMVSQRKWFGAAAVSCAECCLPACLSSFELQVASVPF